MINKLIKLANDLDKRGFKKEADLLDALIKRAGSLEIRGGLSLELEDSEEDPLGESPRLKIIKELK